jgi:hypothetical protein
MKDEELSAVANRCQRQGKFVPIVGVKVYQSASIKGLAQEAGLMRLSG